MFTQMFSKGCNWENPWDKTHEVTNANCLFAFEDLKHNLPHTLKTPVVSVTPLEQQQGPNSETVGTRDTYLKQLLFWPPPESGLSEKGHCGQEGLNKKLSMPRIAEQSVWLSGRCVLAAKQNILACGQVEKLVPFPLLWMGLNSSINGSICGLLPSRSPILLYQQLQKITWWAHSNLGWALTHFKPLRSWPNAHTPLRNFLNKDRG